MRWIMVILILLLAGLQYRLWVGEGSFAEVAQLKREIAEQEKENQRLRARNDVLAREVSALKTGTTLLEERARSELGMIKEGETFYMIVDPE
ncbi:MAG: cell division protein FtsB [Cellvibrionaceae bacterium]